ncbi:hypothetical protein, partial [[Clostridium] symbiosum]|uniref:hypothetical protein n=1 Tax=Clostridium symbiosum TaxID=1512 RepID=UPI001A9B52E2
LLWLCCCGDYIIPKRGGHCFFIFKSGVIPENTRFLIKNGVSDLTLPNGEQEVKDERQVQSFI